MKYLTLIKMSIFLFVVVVVVEIFFFFLFEFRNSFHDKKVEVEVKETVRGTKYLEI